jgi:hypothetical protein
MPKSETFLDSIPGCGEVIPIETIYHQVAERADRKLKAKSVRQRSEHSPNGKCSSRRVKENSTGGFRSKSKPSPPT